MAVPHGRLIMKTSCLNDHDPKHLEVRTDGRRICFACRDLYNARTRRLNRNPSRMVNNEHDS